MLRVVKYLFNRASKGCEAQAGSYIGKRFLVDRVDRCPARCDAMPATPAQRREFGQALRQARTDRGLTIQQAVDALRDQDPTLSTARFSGWETGRYAPSSAAKVKMLDDFFSLDGLLHRLLATPAPEPSKLEELEARVASLEERVAALAPAPTRPTPGRHLRAASSRKVEDPGEGPGETFVRPVGVEPEDG
jgi:transcriptional regulator with XRE-family HTH domain